MVLLKVRPPSIKPPTPGRLGVPDRTLIMRAGGWLIYGPLISSGGRGVERAGHLVLNALHGTGANAKFAGNF